MASEKDPTTQDSPLAGGKDSSPPTPTPVTQQQKRARIPRILIPASDEQTPRPSNSSISKEADKNEDKRATGGSIFSRTNIFAQSWSTFTLPPSWQWIPDNFVWPKLKVVIRSAVAGWISVLLVVINPVLRTIGQVSVIFIPIGRLCYRTRLWPL